MDARKKVRIVI